MVCASVYVYVYARESMPLYACLDIYTAVYMFIALNHIEGFVVTKLV